MNLYISTKHSNEAHNPLLRVAAVSGSCYFLSNPNTIRCNNHAYEFLSEPNRIRVNNHEHEFLSGRNTITTNVLAAWRSVFGLPNVSSYY